MYENKIVKLLSGNKKYFIYDDIYIKEKGAHNFLAIKVSGGKPSWESGISRLMGLYSPVEIQKTKPNIDIFYQDAIKMIFLLDPNNETNNAIYNWFNLR
jgi:hypothetical protein